MRWFTLLAAAIWGFMAVSTVIAGIVGQFQASLFGLTLEWWYVATAFLMAAANGLDRFIGK